MLVGFIGCPKSGKTSVAIRVFDSIKTSGESAELITEQARIYFVEKKFSNPSYTSINDKDQLTIFKRQIDIELKYLKTLSKDTTIISDSSPLNTLWYLSPEARVEHRQFILDELGQYMVYQPLIFRCTPVPGAYGRDENRIHSKTQSEEVNNQIPLILKEFGIKEPEHILEDSLSRRSNDALYEIYERQLRWPGI